MNRPSFGTAAASISKNRSEGALIITHENARRLRARLQWMRHIPLLKDITNALIWIEQNTEAEK